MSKRRDDDEADELRQERILEQLKKHGRLPTPQPGHFHDTSEKQRQKKVRKNERSRLRDLARDHNQGYDDADEDYIA